VISFALGSGVYGDFNASIYVVFGAKLAGLWTNYWLRICPKTVNFIGGALNVEVLGALRPVLKL
jgi:hypothetical protein